jgi:hypothetical protein
MTAPLLPPTMPTDVFHAHLDVCPQCEENPFTLCPAGALLLLSSTGGPDPLGPHPGALVPNRCIWLVDCHTASRYPKCSICAKRPVALVACNPSLPIGGPELPPPTPFIIDLGPGRDREELMLAIFDLAGEARWDGYPAVANILSRVARAMRGARGVDLEYELLIFLEREGVL